MKCSVVKTNYPQCVFYNLVCDFGNKVLRFTDLTSDSDAAYKLCDLLENGDVTETTINDIIDDFINQ